MSAPAEVRFWAKVDKGGPDDCWLWTARVNTRRQGYGVFWDGATKVGAHRFSYELANGPIPAGMTVDHTCYVTACVNPSHLRVLTRSENSKLQRRALAPTCMAGHDRAEHWHVNPSGGGGCRECQRARRRLAAGVAA
jgi:hypothetical protein